MIDPKGIPGMKVTVMGLGINGGGLASALFFARRGADVTVTDLRDREALAASLAELEGLPVRLVLGRHEQDDFKKADLVVKNPAVPPGSPFLQAARAHGAAVETDLSIFLSLAKNPVIAVTGSKGKSTTASAIAFCLARVDPGAKLGGNITVSPLSFLDELAGRTPVVLELSSWQLGDLRGRGLLAPVVSAFTVILPDHLDRYPGMVEYVADKKAIFQEQLPRAKAVFNLDDPWQREFPRETRATSFFYSAGPLPEG
ncbi:MAG: UDP-N-acetylmuramoyl-L-alanine--D-glutamate ligase, partial [Acidobacteria bacterium]|nr:UDP-N-acetylmuramoyl-L-alanine--D-glutamate ligase [Acidobacteriota bacterium]